MSLTQKQLKDLTNLPTWYVIKAPAERAVEVAKALEAALEVIEATIRVFNCADPDCVNPLCKTVHSFRRDHPKLIKKQ